MSLGQSVMLKVGLGYQGAFRIHLAAMSEEAGTSMKPSGLPKTSQQKSLPQRDDSILTEGAKSSLSVSRVKSHTNTHMLMYTYPALYPVG